jgi:hypothetical protein
VQIALCPQIVLILQCVKIAPGLATVRVFYCNVTFNDDKSIHNYAILKLQLCIFQSRQIAGILQQIGGQIWKFRKNVVCLGSSESKEPYYYFTTSLA